jgi:hypothetical protein
VLTGTVVELDPALPYGKAEVLVAGQRYWGDAERGRQAMERGIVSLHDIRTILVGAGNPREAEDWIRRVRERYLPAMRFESVDDPIQTRGYSH